MKLYSREENLAIRLPTELFLQHVENGYIISEESLFDFLYKIKDTFNNVFNRLTGKIKDKVTIDVIGSKFETLHKLKRIDFVKAKDHLVSKPENFEGKFIDYTTDLINSSRIISEDTEKTLNNLKMAIASFINEYKDQKAMTLYGDNYFDRTEKLVESHRKEISRYFPYKNGVSKATLQKVLKNLNDVEQLYKNIEILDSTLNTTRLNYINKLVNDCSELVDSLINVNIRSNILEKNNDIKKSLIKALHISAREVEFLYYLYSNIYMFYGVFKNLIEELHIIEKIQSEG